MSDDSPHHEHPRRRWSVPPVPEWRRAELQILADVDDALAVVLWRAVRDVRAWMEAPPGRRATIVQPPTPSVRERLSYAAAQAPKLAGALGQFTNLLNAPASVDPHALAAACAVVAEWAEERAHSETSIQFAEAAAALADEHAAFANLAARVCKRAALHDRAETWYQRGIGLARRQKDDVEYIYARLGYGEMLADLGDEERGKAHLLKAARRAAQSGRRELAAETQHDLLKMYGHAGSMRQVLDFAGTALKNYSVQHRRVPFLAHDFAYLLIRHRRCAEAYPLARRAADLIPQQAQALAWGTVGYAAAGAGLTGDYHDARQRGEGLAALFPEYAPGTLMMLAEGAVWLGEWDGAERLAASALEVGRVRSDNRIIADALKLLDQIATRTPISVEHREANDRRLEGLVTDFLHRLRMWKSD